MNPPPSWFSLRNFPGGPRRKNSEFEDLAWCYITAQARNGDKWQEITPEELLILLDPSETVFSRHRINEAIKGSGMGYLWFTQISRQLSDANGAFDTAGIMCGREAWKQHCAR